MSADTIAYLKITLDDVKSAVLRRIEVPLDTRLDRLHLAIQAAMGRSNSHLYSARTWRIRSTPPARSCTAASLSAHSQQVTVECADPKREPHQLLL